MLLLFLYYVSLLFLFLYYLLLCLYYMLLLFSYFMLILYFMLFLFLLKFCTHIYSTSNVAKNANVYKIEIIELNHIFQFNWLYHCVRNEQVISLEIFTKLNSVWFLNSQKIVNTVWFWFDWTMFRQDFSVCSCWRHSEIMCAHCSRGSVLI